MTYHLHTVHILTRDDPDGESIGEVLRDHCATLGVEGSNIETWGFDDARPARAVVVAPENLDYDLDLTGLHDDPGAYSPVIGTAVFQGEAWVNDHAIPVDDARYTYPITEAEYAEAWRFREVQEFDTLQEAAAAPRAVKDWPGPFTIAVDFGARKPAVARFIEDPEAPGFDPEEIVQTKANGRYRDDEWDALSLAEQAVILDIDHRR